MTPDQSSKMSSVYSILSLYLAQSNADSQMLKSIFVRYLVPSLGGVKPQGSRAKADEIAQSLSFLKNVEPAQILKLESMLDEQMNQQNVDKKIRRKLVYYVRKFIAWCQSNNYLSTSTQKKEEEDFIKFHASAGEARRDWHAKGQGSKKYHKTTKKHQPYRLGCSDFPEDYFNPRFARQLSEFDKYRVSKGCSAATIKKDRMHLEHILG